MIVLRFCFLGRKGQRKSLALLEILKRRSIEKTGDFIKLRFDFYISWNSGKDDFLLILILRVLRNHWSEHQILKKDKLQMKTTLKYLRFSYEQ